MDKNFKSFELKENMWIHVHTLRQSFEIQNRLIIILVSKRFVLKCFNFMRILEMQFFDAKNVKK